MVPGLNRSLFYMSSTLRCYLLQGFTRLESAFVWAVTQWHLSLWAVVVLQDETDTKIFIWYFCCILEFNILFFIIQVLWMFLWMIFHPADDSSGYIYNPIIILSHCYANGCCYILATSIGQNCLNFPVFVKKKKIGITFNICYTWPAQHQNKHNVSQ